MLKLLVVLFILRAALAKEQSELSTHSLLKARVIEWAERLAGEAASEVREVAGRLQKVVTLADNPNVRRLAELYQKNHHFLHHCDFGAELESEFTGFSSCINVTGDIANVTVLCLYGYKLADDLAGSVVDILNELNDCSEESIWKQITCYKHAFGDIQNDIKEYSVDCNEFLSNATADLKNIEVDFKSCFSFSEKFSTELVESKIESCKLDLEGRQLL